MVEAVLFCGSSNDQVPDLVGRTVGLQRAYRGRYLTGTVVENIGTNWCGVPMYGLHFEGYCGGGQPITCDFAACEFIGDEFAEYRERMKEETAKLREIAGT